MFKFPVVLTILSLTAFSSHAVEIEFGFNDNVLSCEGDDVTVTWVGYHNLVETSGSACDSDELATVEEVFLFSGEQRTYSNNELTAATGERRYFKCSDHCGATFNRFEVYCPAETPTSSPTEFDCTDDRKFRYKSKKKKSCKWIEKVEKRVDKLCKKNEVFNACKVVCNRCCADDMTRIFKVEGQEKTCAWLWQEARKREQCTRPQVNSICAAKCGRCCYNDREFEFDIGTTEIPKPRKCRWFKKKNRAKKWCNQEPSIAEACQQSCNSCEDYTIPITDSPTPSPTKSPAKAPIKSSGGGDDD